MDKSLTPPDEHPLDGVTAFDTESAADKGFKIHKKIGKKLGGILLDKPEQVELVEDSVDVQNIQTLAEQIRDDEGEDKEIGDSVKERDY
jgi:hypothetical protein